MTEDKARECSRLIKKLDAEISMRAKIHAEYKKAKDGDTEALDWLANAALGLQAESVDTIRREISLI